tara:strand:+ start:14267 stop:14677 length:411 start_codon:yes stop_codon:yes gene_type:complete
MKLLVVENHAVSSEVESRILTSAGYEVVTASIGDEALQAIGTVEHCQLVIFDREMPAMNGIEPGRAFPHEVASSIIVDGSGHPFDPDIVDVFLESESEFQAIQSRFTEAPLERYSSLVTYFTTDPVNSIPSSANST